MGQAARKQPECVLDGRAPMRRELVCSSGGVGAITAAPPPRLCAAWRCVNDDSPAAERTRGWGRSRPFLVPTRMPSRSGGGRNRRGRAAPRPSSGAGAHGARALHPSLAGPPRRQRPRGSPPLGKPPVAALPRDFLLRFLGHEPRHVATGAAWLLGDMIAP